MSSCSAPRLAGEPLPADPWYRIGIPVLAIDGSTSAPSVAAAADGLAEHLRIGTRVTLPGQSHNVSVSTLATVIAHATATGFATSLSEHAATSSVVTTPSVGLPPSPWRG